MSQFTPPNYSDPAGLGTQSGTNLGLAPTPPDGFYANAAILPSVRCCHTGGLGPLVSTDGNNSTPVTTEMYLCEVQVPSAGFSRGFSVFNGSDVTGNITAALYDANGKRLALTATIAGSGTDAYQNLPWSKPLQLSAGIYYVGTMYSSATARYNTHTIGSFGAGKITGQTASTPPASCTPPVTFTTALGSMGALY